MRPAPLYSRNFQQCSLPACWPGFPAEWSTSVQSMRLSEGFALLKLGECSALLQPHTLCSHILHVCCPPACSGGHAAAVADARPGAGSQWPSQRRRPHNLPQLAADADRAAGGCLAQAGRHRWVDARPAGLPGCCPRCPSARVPSRRWRPEELLGSTQLSGRAARPPCACAAACAGRH